MNRTAPLAAGAVLCLGGLIAGCGGPDGSGGSGGEPAPTAEPTSTPVASDTPTAEPTDPAAYLPTPAGVALTGPGAELRLREDATAAWEPRQGLVGVVSLAVGRIDVTTVEESLADFQIDPSAAARTPYFVSLEVENVGDTDLGARQLPIYVVDGDERLVAPTGIAPDFEACPGSTLPAIFAPGDTASSCLIFLLDPGTELETVMFRPPEGVVPLTWTGKVTELPDRGRDRPGANGDPDRE